MRTLPAALALLSVLVLSAACGDDGSGPDEDGIHGTYTLQSVDLSSLPFIVQTTAQQKVEVVGGEIILRKDGTFRDELRLHVTPTGGTATPESDILSGTFTRALEILTLTPSGELEGYRVTILENGNLMQTVGSFTMLYVR